MKVSFSIGPRSLQIINTLSKSADNIEFLSYDSVSDMIKQSTMRHIFFDRIVLSERLLSNPEEELKMLNDYIVEYSDNTSVVLICQNSSSGNASLFSKIFNSPLYTPVIVDKVTPTMLLEFVKGDIVSLKTKYYVLDVKDPVGVTSKREQEQVKQVDEVPQEEPAKKGLFKGLFGGKKNKSKKHEIKNTGQEVLNDVGNVAESVSQKVDETVSASVVNGLGHVASSMSSEGDSRIGTDLELVSSKTALGLDGGDNFDGINNDNSLEEDDLSIGFYGEQHFDTGFLDEDIENEIEEAIIEEEKKNSSDAQIEDSVEDIDYSEDKEEENQIIQEEVVKSNTVGVVKNRIVISERGIGSSTYIADTSVKYTSKGRRVLIVDLDYKHNGILSFIDTLNFYRSGCSNGLETLKVYTEDGIDILSDGYGVSVNLDTLLNSGVLKDYDVVLFDCPIDCLDVLTKQLLEDSKVMIKINGNKGSILNTLSSLTSRSNVSSVIEDTLFNCSKFDVQHKIEGYEEDLDYVRNTNFFGRNNWLSKII